MLENTVLRKSAFSSGYENNHGYQTLLPYSGLPGFSYPPFYGVLSMLLSFGKGLLFFAPGLVLVFGRGLQALRSVTEVLILWLLYPNQASDSLLQKVEDCVAKGVTG